MSPPIRVLLVEDDELTLNELSLLVRQHPLLELFATATSIASAQKLLQEPFDVLVVDNGLPDGSGIDLIRKLNSLKDQEKRSIMLTVFDDQETVLGAIEAGADGYLLKHDPHLAEAISAVVESANPLSQEVVSHLVHRVRGQQKPVSAISLSLREKATLQALAEGLKYQQIAERLEISPHTVTDYIKSIYRKLSVNSRSGAVFVGIQNGLVTIDMAG